MEDYSWHEAPWYDYREAITALSLSNGVTSIGNYAFMYCTALTSVTISNSVMSIGYYAFSGCTALTSVTIPNSVTSISGAAFEHCSALTSVTIPDSVKSIGSEAFMYCTALTSVTIESFVTSIDERAFGWYYYSGYQRVDGFTLLAYNRSTAQVYAEENEFAFVSLGDPAPVSGICGGDGDGSNLTWTLNLVTGLLSIEGSGAMKYNNSMEAPWYDYRKAITALSLPNGMTSIGEGAFRYCTALTSVTIPNSVTSIGSRAFYNCSALTSVTIPNSVTSISYSAFEYCTALTSVTIPDSVTSIGSGAFRGCSGLTSVTIPDSVTSIGFYAFENCSALTSVTIESYLTSIGERAFGWYYNSGYQRVDGFTLLAYNQSTARAYAIENEFTFVSLGDPPPVVGTCGEEGDGDNLTWTLNLLTGLLTIEGSGDMANYDKNDTYAPWYNYRKIITELRLLNGVTSVGNFAFYGCTALTSVTVINPACRIMKSSYTFGSSATMVIRSTETSTAHEYANVNGYTFEAIALCEYGHHNYQLSAQQLHTDTKAGWNHWVCADCGEEYTQTVPAGHVFTCASDSCPWDGCMQCVYCDCEREGDASVELVQDAVQTVTLWKDSGVAWLRFTPSRSGFYQLTTPSFMWKDAFDASGNQFNNNNLLNFPTRESGECSVPFVKDNLILRGSIFQKDRVYWFPLYHHGG